MLIAGTIATMVAMAGRRVGRFEVAGDSMLPTLEAGERVLTVRTSRVRAGELAVVDHPRQAGRLLIKRVVGVSAGGSIEVRGDNPAASTDSRHFGPVARTAVHAKVVYRYHPSSRRGRIRPLVP